jgi:hypothetical protein
VLYTVYQLKSVYICALYSVPIEVCVYLCFIQCTNWSLCISVLYTVYQLKSVYSCALYSVPIEVCVYTCFRQCTNWSLCISVLYTVYQLKSVYVCALHSVPIRNRCLCYMRIPWSWHPWSAETCRKKPVRLSCLIFSARVAA